LSGTTLVVDTGLGNLRSVERALIAAGAGEATVLRSSDPERVRRADRLVVPGQGGFGECRRGLASGLDEALLERIRAGTPYLGICLGLQLLFESSEEAPGAAGLCLLRGRVRRIAPGPGCKIPHMGWNRLELEHGGHRLLEAAGGQGAWTYFVHSYAVEPAEPELVKARVGYGAERIVAAAARDNVFASQFHPEKSQQAGLALLAAFLAA
jgi:glutamine amidotransferase